MTSLKGFVAASLLTCGLAATAQTVVEASPGRLALLLSQLPAQTGDIKVTGSIDARDLLALANDANIVSADLAEAAITEYNAAVPLFLQRSCFRGNSFPDYIFFGSGISSLILPDSLQEIGEGAFAASSIKKISGGENVAAIGAYAFRDCALLESLPSFKSLSVLGEMAFAGCSALRYTDLSQTLLKAIPEKCFAGCSNLETLTFPSRPVALGKSAFADTRIYRLADLSINGGDDFALAEMPYLHSIEAQGEINARGVFLGDASLQKGDVGLPDNLPDYYFAKCDNLAILPIIAKLHSIGDRAFSGNLRSSMVLGENLTHIDAEAFSGMSQLLCIDARALDTRVPDIADKAFEGIDQSMIDLVVTDVEFWKGVEEWNKFRVVSTSGIGETSADSGISISLKGSLLTVVAPQSLDAVSVFDIDGTLLLHAAPGTLRYEQEIGLLAEKKVIAVIVSAGENVKTVKFIL